MLVLPERYNNDVMPIGEGGMSDTYLCSDASLNRKVVVKTLKSGFDRRRLLDELRALSSLRSRYVVQVYDVIRSGDEIVGFVEEYLDGCDLMPLAAGCDDIALCRALYPICAGLAEIHQQGIVHRDLKPQNMRFDAVGNLKLLDFGLAKHSTVQGTAQLFYSAGFTAPEAFAMNQSGQFTFSSAIDVFAFGAVAFWLLNHGALPDDLCSIPPRLPSQTADFRKFQNISPPIAQILNSTLDLNPNFRPSAIELKRMISSFLLKDKHKMLLVAGNSESYIINASNKNVAIRLGGNILKINYNGDAFLVTESVGDIKQNNRSICAGDEISGASVIVFRSPYMDITAQVSHPEVLL